MTGLKTDLDVLGGTIGKAFEGKPNREEWLGKAALLMRPRLQRLMQQPTELPNIRISAGFGYGSQDYKAPDVLLGETNFPDTVDDGIAEVFISPVFRNVAAPCPSILSTVLHELLHAYCGILGHNIDFIDLSQRLGFVGNVQQAGYCNPQLSEWLAEIAALLGPWPGSRIMVDHPDYSFSEPVDEEPVRANSAIHVGSFIADPNEAIEALAKVVNEPATAVPDLYEARLVLATFQQNGKPIGEPTLGFFEDETARLFGGFTKTIGRGAYIMASGKVKKESIRVLDVAMSLTDGGRIEQLAREFKTAGNQESVYLRCPNGTVLFL